MDLLAYQVDRCSTCHDLMGFVNENLATKGYDLAEYILTNFSSDHRPDLDAQGMLGALQELILTPEYFCAQVVSQCPMIYKQIDINHAVTQILHNKPNDADGYIQRVYDGIKGERASRKTITVVHISDAHFDLKYLPGSTADCGLSYCCRAESETGQGSILAGEWGAPANSQNVCDASPKIVQSAFDHINANVDYDLVFWTGDNTAHDDPWVSQDEINDELLAIIDTVHQSFGAEKVFVSLGNHDSFPFSQWDFQTFGPQQKVRDMLYQFVPESQRDSYDQHGYYSVDLPSINARVLSLNTQSCDFRNDYLFASLSDPNRQIGWLHDHLLDLESTGTAALILGHIPDDCSNEYMVRYQALMDRFQKTVRISAFGHTHRDMFKLIPATSGDEQFTGVQTICSSLTTWGGVQPSYCVYELDAETLLPVSKKIFAYDIATANAQGFPDWHEWTDWLVDYQMEDLSPGSYYDLAKRLHGDAEATTDYLLRQWRRQSGLDCSSETCLLEHWCDMVYLTWNEVTTCKNLPIYEWRGNFYGALRRLIQGPWMERIDGVEFYK